MISNSDVAVLNILNENLEPSGSQKAQDRDNRGPALHTKNSPLTVWAIEPRDTGFLWGIVNMRATTQNIKQYHETMIYSII
jgi:hypothetical protein